MNQSKAFLISFLCAGIAGFLVFFYVNQEKQKVKAQYGAEVVVVVAAEDINEMEQIQSNRLKTIVIPSSFAQPGSDPDPRTFEGTVASAPIKAGEQMLLTKVLLKGAATGIASQVAISRRAISVPVNDVTGVTRLLRPGDRIDLISNIQYQSGEGVQSEVKTLLQNINVLAVGELVQNQVPAAFENDPMSGNRKAVNLRGNRNFDTVTLEVTPQDAQRIIFVVENGASLYLSLRNPVDRIIASVPTTTVDEVLGANSRKADKERAANQKVFQQPERVERRPAPPPPPPPPPAFSQGGVPIAN